MGRGRVNIYEIYEPHPERGAFRGETHYGQDCPTCLGTGTGDGPKFHELSEAKQGELIKLPCLECGKLHTFKINSYEARGVFNVFCPDKDCEDRYAWKQ